MLRVFDTEGWARKKVERPGSPHLAVCFANPTRRDLGALRRLQAEGVGFEPTRAFRPNALAGRRLKPLGHPSGELPLLGSNQDSPDPESGVLPITPRGKNPSLANVAQACREVKPRSCGTRPSKSHQSDLNRRPRHYE
jgi:hypothetical protein